MPTEKELATYKKFHFPSNYRNVNGNLQVGKNRNKMIFPIDGEHIGK